MLLRGSPRTLTLYSSISRGLVLSCVSYIAFPLPFIISFLVSPYTLSISLPLSLLSSSSSVDDVLRTVAPTYTRCWSVSHPKSVPPSLFFTRPHPSLPAASLTTTVIIIRTAETHAPSDQLPYPFTSTYSSPTAISPSLSLSSSCPHVHMYLFSTCNARTSEAGCVHVCPWLTNKRAAFSARFALKVPRNRPFCLLAFNISLRIHLHIHTHTHICTFIHNTQYSRLRANTPLQRIMHADLTDESHCRLDSRWR